MINTDTHQAYVVEYLVPYASAFFCQNAGTDPKEFLRYLTEIETSAEAAGRTTSLLARGIRAASLNGEVDEALRRAQLLGEVRYWHDVLCLDKTRSHLGLEDHIRTQRGLTDQGLAELRPLISWALSKCLHV